MRKKNKTKNAAVSDVRYGADVGGCLIDSRSNLIRERAYRLFEARGRQPGYDLDDWLQAEREISAQLIA